MNEDDELKDKATENKAKNVLNEGKSKLVGAVKKLFMLILKKCAKGIIIGVSIILLFVALFHQWENVIFEEVVTITKDAVKTSNNSNQNSNEDSNFAKTVEIIQDGGKWCIKIDKGITDSIEKGLKDKKTEPRHLNLENFDCFREFIKAEIMTQYPVLSDKKLSNDTQGDIITNGLIAIKRIKPGEKNAIQIYYTDQESFKKLCESNDEKALNCFTINDNRELVIANYEKTTVKGETTNSSVEAATPDSEEYTIDSTNIDYLSIVDKYTMPFALQLAILQTSDSVELALEFAKLAQESELEITIQDNIETNTCIETSEIEQKYEGTKNLTYQINKNETTVNATTGNVTTTTVLEGPQESAIPIDPQQVECTTKTTTVTETDTPNLELTKIDTWIAKFNRTYKAKTKTEKSTDGPTEGLEEEQIQCDINTDADVNTFLNGRIQYWNSAITDPVPADTTREIVSQRITLNADVKKVKRKETTVDSTTVTKKFKTKTANVESNEDKIFKIFSGNIAKERDNDEQLAKKLREGYGSIYDAQKWFYNLLKKEETTKNFIDTMKYLINKYKDKNYDGKLDLEQYDADNFETATSGSDGTGGVFGCNLTREEFIKKAKAYKKGDSAYQNNLAKYAGDFYDACKKYNVNPCLAFAHACLETGYGSSSECQSIKNYFGMAHGNTSASGKSYSSVKDSVEDYCKWIIENTTAGTDAYNQSSQVSKKYAKKNKAFSGDPATNMYDLYSRYAFLGATHVTANDDYTVEWGKGGRTYTRIIYGGYDYSSKSWKSKNKYDKECGNKHPKANDKTTTKEQADYAEYSMNNRISILTSIFGEDAMATGSDLLTAAKTIHTYMEQNKYAYCTLGNEKDPSHNGFGKSHGLDTTFEASKKGHHLTCCATYVSWALIDAGYTKVQGAPRQHSGAGLGEEIQRLYKCEKITKKSKLKPGDICFWCTGGRSHTQIYGEKGVWYNAGSNQAILGKPRAYAYNTWDYALRLLE